MEFLGSLRGDTGTRRGGTPVLRQRKPCRSSWAGKVRESEWRAAVSAHLPCPETVSAHLLCPETLLLSPWSPSPFPTGGFLPRASPTARPSPIAAPGAPAEAGGTARGFHPRFRLQRGTFCLRCFEIISITFFFHSFSFLEFPCREAAGVLSVPTCFTPEGPAVVGRVPDGQRISRRCPGRDVRAESNPVLTTLCVITNTLPPLSPSTSVHIHFP